ncbi:RNA-directed DNA polymerase [Peribacillus butanolivorans]|uniref:RNA-directed DNA polymerase n=1 Tax=Peribacillus butanolivorans TaxID=421767 RepID=UPI00366913D6
MKQTELLKQLDLSAAIDKELAYTTKLLPNRTEQRVLPTLISEVEKQIRGALQRGGTAEPAGVVVASKTKGLRPLNLWRLQDRIYYRALTERLRPQMPPELQQRGSHTAFETLPYENERNEFIVFTDITAYYQYIDHDVLTDELIAQTGDFHTVMGGRVGIPQVHDCSDFLGDIYIDPIRRALIRAGYDAHCFADDFRIGCSSLGQARAALELCASAARNLGLVLNDAKTYTYHRVTYAGTLNRISAAESELLQEINLQGAADFLFREDYSDTVVDIGPLQPDFSGIDDATPPRDDEENSDAPGLDANAIDLVRGVWQVWATNNKYHGSQTVRLLLASALPVLGELDDMGPMNYLEDLLDISPDLTPKVADYLEKLARVDDFNSHMVGRKIDNLVRNDRLSDWQRLWLAHAASAIRGTIVPPPTAEWLNDCVRAGSDILAAYAADALGQLKTGDFDALAAALNRVGAEHRLPIVWALGQLDADKAREIVDSELERLMLPAQP